MKKVTLGPQTLLYPLPAVIVGANVGSKANFMTAAWCGIACGEPPMLTVGIRPNRLTLKGIRENQTFSVSVPSVDQVREADYCGSVTGAKDDKVKTCNLSVFYGKLGSAPLIDQCPVGLECRVVHMIELGSHTLVVGKIEETHVSDDCLTDGKPDVAKIRPFCYSKGVTQEYLAMGPVIGQAFSVGLALKPKK